MNIPEITVSMLTNRAYGYPARGNARRIKPLLLACIHITGNQNNLGDNAAMNERNYANRVDSPGPSSHYYINRDGSAVKAIDPLKFAAWGNGDVQSPKTDFMGYDILKGVYLDEGFNANEAFLLEFENCAYSSSYPILQAQKETMAYLMASFSLSQDIPIDRSTVFGHSDINSVNRPNDPVPKAQLDAFLTEVITLAEQYKKEIITGPLTLQVAGLSKQVDTLQGVIQELNTRIVDLEDQLRQKQAELDECHVAYTKAVLEKNELQGKYNDLMTRYLEAAGQVQVLNTVKEYWKYLDSTLNS